MPKTETIPNGIMIDGTYRDTNELVRRHDIEIGDLRIELEQLQEAVGDTSYAGIATEPTVERYARVNITKGAKGDYRHETTVTVTMTGGDWTALQEELCAGLRAADGAARIEIEQRIGWDQHPHESDDDPVF